MKYNKIKCKFFEDDRVVNSGIIIINNKKSEPAILLLERKDHKHWELPGGKVEFKDKINGSKIDTLKNAALREVKEETGIYLKNKLSDMKPFYIDFISPEGKKRRSYNFIAFSNKYPVLEKGFSDWEYIPLSNLKKYKLAPNVIILDKRIKKGLFNKFNK